MAHPAGSMTLAMCLGAGTSRSRGAAGRVIGHMVAHIVYAT